MVSPSTFSSRARRGLTRTDALVAGLLIALLGGSMLYATLYMRRVSRDAASLSSVRQAQSALALYRGLHAAYPAVNDPSAPKGFSYRLTPEGCGADVPCDGYALNFTLEGPLGGLAGGTCLATRETITCQKPR